jgi:hypothetical protein
MPLPERGRVELYVYYRVARSDEGAVRAAIAARHAQWREAHPGLDCALLRRDDAGAADVTLMETYTGLDADALLALDVQARAVVAPWVVGERHLERFTRCA